MSASTRSVTLSSQCGCMADGYRLEYVFSLRLAETMPGRHDNVARVPRYWPTADISARLYGRKGLAMLVSMWACLWDPVFENAAHP